MSDDLSIDDLLAAVSTSKTPTRKSAVVVEPTAPVWGYIPISYKCLQCGRVYKGQLFHPSNDTYTKPHDEKVTSWCPRCLDEKLWWAHQNFEIEEVYN
jgi:hypothetical protein